MKFLEIKYNLARILLGKFAFALAVLCFFVSPIFSEGSEEPVILPGPELVAPVQLIDGIVSEVTVPERTLEIAVDRSVPGNGITVPSHNPDNNESSLYAEIANTQEICQPKSPRWAGIKFSRNGACTGDASVKKYPGGGTGQLKSIANPGLIAFFEICLSQSALPSRNSSMPCESSLSKSMTQRSANAWKSSWQPARMTFLWHRSICSSQTPRISILEPSQSRLPSMSDISSTWSSAMVAYLQTSPEMTELAALSAIRRRILLPS